MDAKFSASAKLFLSIAKSAISGSLPEALGTPRPEAAVWEKFKTLAAYHELAPFLYLPISKRSSWVPEDVQTFLRDYYYAGVMRSQNALSEFFTLAALFSEKHIDMVPIKGTSLLLDIYYDNPVRPMADIDILVRREDFTEAKAVLSSLGYEANYIGLKPEYWLEKHCEVMFRSREKKKVGTVDAHFALDLPPRAATLLPRLWERTREFVLEGHKVRVLSPEDHLFCLALHQRRFGGKALCLKNVFDLVMILKKHGDSFDWDYVVSEARAGKMRSTVFFLLLKAHLFFEANVPAFVWEQLNVPAYKKTLIKRMLGKDVFDAKTHQESKRVFLKTHLLLYDDLWEPLRYLLNIPIEQFAKYYDLDPYRDQTKRRYKARIFYMPFRFLKEIFRLR